MFSKKKEINDLIESVKSLSDDMRQIKARLVSIESWLAALSKGKDLSKSHTFAKDITDLQERVNPTIQIQKDDSGEITKIETSQEWEGKRITFYAK